MFNPGWKVTDHVAEAQAPGRVWFPILPVKQVVSDFTLLLPPHSCLYADWSILCRHFWESLPKEQQGNVLNIADIVTYLMYNYTIVPIENSHNLSFS